MYAITGITGKVGGELARTLLAAEQPVRAIVRDARKAAAWASLGCEIAVADMEDAQALATAFAGATAVFILPPSDFDPGPGYPAAKRVIDSVVAALRTARPDRVLCLSTIGADASQDNLLTQRSMMEAALRETGLSTTFLRAGWFIDNSAWDVSSAREQGVIGSFLAPLDRPIPMVASQDVGRAAAALIQQDWVGTRVVELEGPYRVSPNDLAEAFAAALGRPVRAVLVPRDSWETLFREQGMKHPGPRMRMLDGFNEGWIDFFGPAENRLKGSITVDAAIEALVKAEVYAPNTSTLDGAAAT